MNKNGVLVHGDSADCYRERDAGALVFTGKYLYIQHTRFFYTPYLLQSKQTFFLFKLTEYFSWELGSGIQSCNSTATRCVPNVLTFQN